MIFLWYGGFCPEHPRCSLYIIFILSLMQENVNRREHANGEFDELKTEARKKSNDPDTQ